MTSEVNVRRSSWHRLLVYSTRKGWYWYKYSLWQYTGQTRDSTAPVPSAVKLYYPAAWAQGCVCCPVRVIKSLCTLNTPRKCFLIKIDVWGKVTVLPGFLLLFFFFKTNEKCYVLTWEFKATELHLTKLREILFETSGSSSHTVHASIWKSIQLRCNLLSWEFLAWNKFQKNLWDFFFPFPHF